MANKEESQYLSIDDWQAYKKKKETLKTKTEKEISNWEKQKEKLEKITQEPEIGLTAKIKKSLEEHKPGVKKKIPVIEEEIGLTAKIKKSLEKADKEDNTFSLGKLKENVFASAKDGIKNILPVETAVPERDPEVVKEERIKKHQENIRLLRELADEGDVGLTAKIKKSLAANSMLGFYQDDQGKDRVNIGMLFLWLFILGIFGLLAAMVLDNLLSF